MPFGRWEGAEEVNFIHGSQGLYMLAYRLQLSGDEIPVCPSHSIQAWRCAGGDCAGDKTLLAQHNAPAETYDDSDTTRLTETLYIISFDVPDEGDTVQLVSTVADLTRVIELTVGETIWGRLAAHRPREVLFNS